MGNNKTRQNIQRDTENPEPHVDSGYEGDDTSDDFTIPPVGIEDCDVALFNLFDKDIGFTSRVIEGANKDIQIKKPFVVFATGERFALAKRLRPPRDRNSTIMLPAISIRRTSIDQAADDITSRGINQFTGNMVVKRRLDDTDRDYQNLINKIGFRNLKNLPKTDRDTGEYSTQKSVQEGGLLDTRVSKNNIWEIITVPQPQFFTAHYEVVFWTNFTQHMNYMIETYLSSFLPNDRIHKLVTDKGYWFLAYTEDQFPSQENFDDFKGDERLVRYSFNVKIRGYILAPQHPTNQVPVRRWVSAPNVVFDVRKVNSEVQPKDHLARPPQTNKEQSDQFTLTDIERDPETKQAPTTAEKFAYRKDDINPITGKKNVRYVSVLESNEAKGETVYRATDTETLEEFIKTLK